MTAKLEVTTKAVVAVAEMARMVGLSRARFYQLQGTTFPWPVYDIATRRPIYTEEQQRTCLEVRRRNCGIDGRPILFYARRITTAPASRPRPAGQRTSARAGGEDHEQVVAAVKALGLTWATAAQVATAMGKLFPKGPAGVEQGEVIRSVFMHLRQNSADNVGR